MRQPRDTLALSPRPLTPAAEARGPAQQQSLLAAVMTPRGRGAVAVIRVAGDLTSSDRGLPFRAVNERPLSAQPIGKIVFGQWGNDSREDVVVCRLEERMLEVHCHGGEQAVE